MLRNNGGKYFPSFFCIKLETDSNPQDYLQNNLTSTIVHEYVHFIQDISTVYGLTNLSKNFANAFDFYNIKEKSICLPYKFDSSYTTNNINKELFDIYYADCSYLKIPKYVNWEVDIIPKSANEYGFEFSKDLLFYEIKISSEGYEKTFDFGACSIMECMASLIEKHLFPFDTTYYEIPYDLPVLVANSLLDGLGEKKNLIVALCDVSLMFYHSGKIFIKSIEMMKNQNYMPTCVDDIYSFVFSNISLSESNIHTLFNNSVNTAINDINNIVNVDREEFTVPRDWAIKAIQDYYKLRIRNITFLSSIMELPKLEAQVNLFTLFKSHISPAIYNQKYEFSIIGSSENTNVDYLIYWFYLKSMFSFIFYDENIHCPFNEICQMKKVDCSKYPWLKKGYPYCIYEQFARIFALYKRDILTPAST